MTVHDDKSLDAQLDVLQATPAPRAQLRHNVMAAIAREPRRTARSAEPGTPHGGSLHYPPNTFKGALYSRMERAFMNRTDLFLFESAFGRWELGYASAAAEVLFLIILADTLTQYWATGQMRVGGRGRAA